MTSHFCDCLNTMQIYFVPFGFVADYAGALLWPMWVAWIGVLLFTQPICHCTRLQIIFYYVINKYHWKLANDFYTFIQSLTVFVKQVLSQLDHAKRLNSSLFISISTQKIKKRKWSIGECMCWIWKLLLLTLHCCFLQCSCFLVCICGKGGEVTYKSK